MIYLHEADTVWYSIRYNEPQLDVVVASIYHYSRMYSSAIIISIGDYLSPFFPIKLSVGEDVIILYPRQEAVFLIWQCRLQGDIRCTIM